jgi:hypothetical protein
MTAVVSKFIRLNGYKPSPSDWAITRTWPLSPRIMATITISLDKMVLELNPDPRERGWKLTADEIATYEKTYHEVLVEIANKAGGPIGSVEFRP